MQAFFLFKEVFHCCAASLLKHLVKCDTSILLIWNKYYSLLDISTMFYNSSWQVLTFYFPPCVVSHTGMWMSSPSSAVNIMVPIRADTRVGENQSVKDSWKLHLDIVIFYWEQTERSPTSLAAGNLFGD